MSRTLAEIMSKYFNGNWNNRSSNELTETLKQSHNLLELKKTLTTCLGDSDLSIPILNRIIGLDPNDLESVLSLGWVYWSIGEEKNSRNILSMAERLNPDAQGVLQLKVALDSTFSS
jgi:tetratricopeptide (TPR) repeat protein